MGNYLPNIIELCKIMSAAAAEEGFDSGESREFG